jgi:hypothetical protein
VIFAHDISFFERGFSFVGSGGIPFLFGAI